MLLLPLMNFVKYICVIKLWTYWSKSDVKSHLHEWILDFGASFHVSLYKAWFENLQESKSGHTILCNNHAYKIARIGNITLKFDTSYVLKWHEVRYIPEIGRNLISVGALETDGFSGKIGNNMLKMIKGALVTCKGIKRNGIYVTAAEIIKNSSSSINLTNKDDTHKWHNRLAHISIKGLKLLNDKGVFGNDCV